MAPLNRRAAFVSAASMGIGGLVARDVVTFAKHPHDCFCDHVEALRTLH